MRMTPRQRMIYDLETEMSVYAPDTTNFLRRWNAMQPDVPHDGSHMTPRQRRIYDLETEMSVNVPNAMQNHMTPTGRGNNGTSNRQKGLRNLSFENIPVGVSLPAKAREDPVTLVDIPFGVQVYLTSDLGRNGKPLRVYQLSTLKKVVNQKNPFTRRLFSRNDIRRVACPS